MAALCRSKAFFVKRLRKWGNRKAGYGRWVAARPRLSALTEQGGKYHEVLEGTYDQGVRPPCRRA